MGPPPGPVDRFLPAKRAFCASAIQGWGSPAPIPGASAICGLAAAADPGHDTDGLNLEGSPP
jgi:hypothetical protein